MLCLLVCLPVCLPATLPACLPACLSVCLSVSLSVCLSVSLSVYLSPLMHARLFVHTCMCLSNCFLTVRCLFIFACLPVCLSACLSVCLYLPACLSVCFFPCKPGNQSVSLIVRRSGGQGRCSVVRESEFKSEDPGFDPLAGQYKNQCFLSYRVTLSLKALSAIGTLILSFASTEATLVQTCLCLQPLRVKGTHICAHVKYPTSICRKRVGLTTGGIETGKLCTQETSKQDSWVGPVFPLGKSARISRALLWDQKVI